jgi:putative endopeptidase
MTIGPDDKHPTPTSCARQAGLGLPDRDYYLRDDKDLAATREAYKKYLAQTLVSVGVAAADAETRAAAVYTLEHDIAVVHWPAADRRDADKTYNPLTVPELKSLAPDYPWEASFAAAGIPMKARGADRTVIVSEKSAFPPIAKIFAATPISVWRDFLTIRCIHSSLGLPAGLTTPIRVLPDRPARAQLTARPDHEGVRFPGSADGSPEGIRREVLPARSEAKRALVNNPPSFGEDLKTLDWMTPRPVPRLKKS